MLGALFVLAGVAAGSAGCRGGEARPVGAPRVSLGSETSALVAFATPAIWRYHPLQPARVNAELLLASGDRLLAGRRGERWLLSKLEQRLEAASVLAPEELVGIQRAPAGGFVFVGASGVGYEAHGPIAPFFRASAPLESLSSVASSPSAIIGIRRDRGLLRSADGGATWKPVGPPGTKFVAVSLGDADQGLALAIPEALFATRDGGVTFQRIAARSVGAFGFDRLPERKFGVLAALGMFEYREAQAPPLVAYAPVQPTQSGPELPTPRGPNAGALVQGRAVAVVGDYYEISPGEKSGSWSLTSGSLGGPLASRLVPELAGCRAARLAAFDTALTLACFRAGAETATQPIELFRSDDRGATFSAERLVVEGNLSTFRFAHGAAGALLLTGVCPVYAAGSGCAPLGVARRAPVAQGPSRHARSHASDRDGPKPNAAFEIAASATPSLAEVALALGFSADGRIAYAVGKSTKAGALSVFVSRDAGRSFEAEELAVPTGEAADGEERWERSAVGVRVEALVAAEDGTLALAVSRYRSRVWLVLDESGRVLSVARPPDPRALLGVAGSRALAVSVASREVWESLDAGASFRNVGRFPIELCPGDGACDVALACAAFGCVVGSDISRLGWGGDPDDEAWMLPPPPATNVDYSVPQLKTPISCLLDGAPWQVLEGVTDLPTAFESAIGQATWFAPGADPVRAAAWAWVAYAGVKPRVERESIFPPSERGRAYAMAVSGQVEGVAALRYLAPDPTSATAHLTGVELGWLNLLEGRRRRASLADAGAYAPGDFSRGPRGTQVAEPALLSIAEGGIYLRIHRGPADNQPTLFFDGQRTATIPPVPWPVTGVRGTHSEMAHVDGQHVPLLLVGRGSAVVRARFEAGNPVFEAYATGALDPARFGTAQNSNIAYVGTRAGQVIETFDSGSARAEAQLFTFRARGEVLDAPVEVPTQLSLGERPQRCDAASVSSSPRVVAPHHPGTRHPVIISDGGDAPQTFMTAYAVLHGSPAAPCVAAFDAEPLGLEGAQVPQVRAILPVADLAQSFLFRATGQAPGLRVEYHSISCKLDPGAEVPPEVYRAPGALVPRAR